MKSTILLALATIVASIAGSVSVSDAASRPNVVLVMCDDLGWGDVGFNGAEVCRTPHLDAMAAHCLRFNRFYAAAPVCSPTRGSALTGRHPYRYGITSANAGHMKREETTLAELLKSEGYATGHFGKWHLGTLTTKVQDSNRGAPGQTEHYATPAMHGFDVYFATEAKVPTWDPLLQPKTFGAGESRRYGWVPVADADEAEHYGTHYWNGEESVATEGLRGDDSRIVMNQALPFIRRSVEAEKPFLAVIWFHTPHLPVVAGERYREMYADRPLKERLYYGSITAMDEQVGRLREELRRLNAAENTLLWFASDNGPERGTPGSAGPFRGRKRSLYEGGVRVPGLLEWPAKIRSGRESDIPAVTSDYLPTVAAALGLSLEQLPQPIDGVSLMGAIEGRMKERPRPIGFQTRGMATLSDNRYKLVAVGKMLELYDLLEDPSESTDLAQRLPDVVGRMSAELRAWQSSCARSARGDDYGEGS